MIFEGARDMDMSPLHADRLFASNGIVCPRPVVRRRWGLIGWAVLGGLLVAALARI